MIWQGQLPLMKAALPRKRSLHVLQVAKEGVYPLRVSAHPFVSVGDILGQSEPLGLVCLDLGANSDGLMVMSLRVLGA